jgi:hypothetical protein
MLEDQILVWLLFVGITLVFLSGLSIMYVAKKPIIDQLKREKAELTYQLRVRDSEYLDTQSAFDCYCDGCKWDIEDKQEVVAEDDVAFDES